VADAIHQRQKEVLDRVGGVVEHFFEPLGVLLLGGAGVARRLDGPVQAEDGQLALGDLGVEVGVALFHVRKKAVLGDEVAVVGVAQGVLKIFCRKDHNRLLRVMLFMVRQPCWFTQPGMELMVLRMILELEFIFCHIRI
jgi:hypothetical protein